MPTITGYLCPTLTVTDRDRSAVWYRDLFDMVTRRENIAPDGHVRDVCLVEPTTGLEICLVEYTSGSREAFDEFRPGLDHLEFLVANRSDLDDWAARLDSLGIAHSGVKEPSYTKNAMITFRDPDNIQLEFFWLAPRDDTGVPRLPSRCRLRSGWCAWRSVACTSSTEGARPTPGPFT